MKSVEEFIKPVSAEIHAAALNLQGAIEKERDDKANAAKKIIADDNHREFMLRMEAANDVANKRRMNRIKEAKENEVAHETMSDATVQQQTFTDLMEIANLKSSLRLIISGSPHSRSTDIRDRKSVV